MPIIEKHAEKSWHYLCRQVNSVESPCLETSDSLSTVPLACRTVCTTTDDAEKPLRKKIRKYHRRRRSTFSFGRKCFQHQGSLACKTGIKNADLSAKTWGLHSNFFSATAKLIHHIRANFFGMKKRKPHLFKTFPAKPSGTRWGGWAGSLKWIFKIPPTELVNSVNVSINASAAKRKRKGTKRKAELVDEMNIDETNHFRETRSKWATDTSISVNCSNYFVFLKIQHMAGGAWDHFHLFLQSSTTKLGELVRSKATAIAAEFHTALLNFDAATVPSLFLCTILKMSVTQRHVFLNQTNIKLFEHNRKRTDL